MDSETEIASGLLLTLLWVMFIMLKLTGIINWSWWWVLSPAWIPLAIAVVFISGLTMIVALKK